jgi:hypothetical protein
MNLREVAGCIGLVAEADDADAVVRLSRLKRSLMTTIGAPVTPKVLPTNGHVAPPMPRNPLATFNFPVWPLAFSFACLVALLCGLSAIELHDQVEKDRGALAMAHAQTRALQRRRYDEEARLQTIVASDARRYPNAYGLVVQDPNQLLLVLHALPPLPPGHVYQAWTLPTHSKIMKAEATFVIGANGVAYIRVPAHASNVAAVGVTIEPAGGSVAPTTKPIFVQLLG